MTYRNVLRVLGVALVAAALTACGGGGGGGGGDTGGVTPPPTTQELYDEVVVSYDLTGDGLLDMVTLDKAESPYVIVSVLEGQDDGGSVDRTADWEGTPIDASVSDALANHLADSWEIASEQEVTVVDSSGNEHTVTVFE